jgi:hypothetical protein
MLTRGVLPHNRPEPMCLRPTHAGTRWLSSLSRHPAAVLPTCPAALPCPLLQSCSPPAALPCPHLQVQADECTGQLDDVSEKQLKTLEDWEAKFAAKYGVVGQVRAWGLLLQCMQGGQGR